MIFVKDFVYLLRVLLPCLFVEFMYIFIIFSNLAFTRPFHDEWSFEIDGKIAHSFVCKNSDRVKSGFRDFFLVYF